MGNVTLQWKTNFLLLLVYNFDMCFKILINTGSKALKYKTSDTILVQKISCKFPRAIFRPQSTLLLSPKITGKKNACPTGNPWQWSTERKNR